MSRKRPSVSEKIHNIQLQRGLYRRSLATDRYYEQMYSSMDAVDLDTGAVEFAWLNEIIDQFNLAIRNLKRRCRLHE